VTRRRAADGASSTARRSRQSHGWSGNGTRDTKRRETARRGNPALSCWGKKDSAPSRLARRARIQRPHPPAAALLPQLRQAPGENAETVSFSIPASPAGCSASAARTSSPCTRCVARCSKTGWSANSSRPVTTAASPLTSTSGATTTAWKPTCSSSCEFRRKLDTDSSRSWTVIPRQAGH